MVRKFLTHVLPGVIKPLRVLWNEMLGSLFAVFAVVPLIKAVREWDALRENLPKLALYVLFIAVMGGFAIQSFRRARKISRS